MRLIVVPFIMALSVAPALAEGGAFPPFDSRSFAGQLFWLTICFGALYLLMSRVAVPRIGSILAEREGTIETALAAAAKAQAGAESEAAALEASLAKAKTNAQTIAQDAKAKSNAEIEAKRKAVETDLAAKMSAAEASIGDMKAKAMANVEDIAKDATAALVEQLTGKAPTAAALTKAFKSA